MLFQASFYMIASHHNDTNGLRCHPRFQIPTNSSAHDPDLFGYHPFSISISPRLYSLTTSKQMDASISTSFYQQVHDKINTIQSCDQPQVFNKTCTDWCFFHKSNCCSFPWSPTWSLLDSSSREVDLKHYHCSSVYHPSWNGYVRIPHKNWWPFHWNICCFCKKHILLVYFGLQIDTAPFLALNIPEAHVQNFSPASRSKSDRLALLSTLRFIYKYLNMNLCLRKMECVHPLLIYHELIQVLSMYHLSVYAECVYIHLSINPSIDPSKIHGALLISSNAVHVRLRCIHWLSDRLIHVHCIALRSGNRMISKKTPCTKTAPSRTNRMNRRFLCFWMWILGPRHKEHNLPQIYMSRNPLDI